MSDLQIQHEVRPSGVHLITCVGVLDAHTSPRLDEVVEGSLAKGATHLAIDVQGVSYVASAGVGVFLGCVSTLRERNGDLALIYPRHVDALEGERGLTEGFDVLEVFDLLGLDGAIPVVRTLAEVEASLGG